MQEKSCGCVVFRKENEEIVYLFLVHRNNHLDFPKGHQDNGETDEQTCARELVEETGIGDAISHDFEESIQYDFSFEGNTVQKQVVYFLREVKNDSVVVSEEHQGFEWLPFEEAMKRLVFDNQKELLEKAHKKVLSLN